MVHYLFFIKNSKKNIKIVHYYSFLEKIQMQLAVYLVFFQLFFLKNSFGGAVQTITLSMKSPSLILLNVLFQSVLNCYQKLFRSWIFVKFSFFKKVTKMFTVIRSPFVYKSSREQFCIVMYQAKLFLQMKSFYISNYLELFLVKVLCTKLASVKSVMVKKLTNRV